jgi:hypothetical protein
MYSPVKPSELDFVGKMFGVKLEKRRGMGTLVHFYVEDDEVYGWKVSFDEHWLTDAQDILERTRRKLNRDKK